MRNNNSGKSQKNNKSSRIHYKETNLMFDESDFIDYSEMCPICESTKRKRLAQLENSVIWFFECNDCYTVSASHYPTDAAISRLYSSFYSENLVHDSEGVTHDDASGLAKHINDKISSLLGPNVSILDYGGGSGDISYRIAKLLIDREGVEKIDILIVDFNEEHSVISNDKRIDFKRIHPNSFISEDKVIYDIIIASAVLEHEFFAGKLMSLLFSKMSSTGYIYIRVPYIMPIYLLLSKIGIKIDIGFPAHLHDFSKRFFDNLPTVLNLQNLEVVISQPADFQYSFRKHFTKALFSRLIRLPYYLSKSYPYVGSWEVIYHKKVTFT